MKKKIILVSLILIYSIFFCSCSKENGYIENNDISVPFLMYENNEENNTIESKLLYWNISTGTILDNNNIIYHMSSNESSIEFIEPIIWGNDKFILNNIDSIKVNSNYNIEQAENSSLTIWGKNIKVITCFDDSQNFNGHKIIIDKDGKQEEFMTPNFTFKVSKKNIIGVFPSYVSYNDTKDEVVFLSVDFTSSNLDKIYVFKANTKNISEVNMRTICLSECIKNNGNAMPTPFNAVMSDNEYYFQSFNSLAYCDISTEKSNTLDSLTARCREIIKEGKFKPDFEKAIIPIGSYKGIVLINVPISTDTDLENLVCAVSNNKIIGSIHLKKNGIWDIRKGEKSISSVFDVSDKNLYVKFYEYLNFPKY